MGLDPSAIDTTESTELARLTAKVEALEAELRRRDAQLEDIERLARIGSWEWDIEANQVEWSPELYSIFGHDPAAFEPSYEGFVEAVHSEDRDRVEKALDSALGNSGPYAVAHRVVRPDGGERLVICRAQVVRDAHGKPTRMVGATVDLSEYRGVADGVRARQEQLNAAESLAGIASFEWDVEADRVRWSDGMYTIFGLERDEFDGTFDAYLSMVHPDDRIERRAQIDALLASGGSLEGEQRILRPDGEVRVIASKLKAISSDVSGIVSVIGVCRDVTAE